MHKINQDSLGFAYATLAHRSLSTKSDRPCPFCLCTLESLEELQAHVATHLQRIALFALPRSTEADDGFEKDDGVSCVANHEIYNSQAELESLSSTYSDAMFVNQGTTDTSLTAETLKGTEFLDVTDQRNIRVVAFVRMAKGGIDEVPDTISMVNITENVNRRTMEKRETVLGKEYPSTLTNIGNLALALQYQGKYKAAEELASFTGKYALA